jgi:hypothetical protein
MEGGEEQEGWWREDKLPGAESALPSSPPPCSAVQLVTSWSTDADTPSPTLAKEDCTPRFREVCLPDEVASAVFPPSPAFMTDDERRALEEVERREYLDRLDRRLRNIARRKGKERKQGSASIAHSGGRARSEDQWAHVGLDDAVNEEREAEERMMERERERIKLAHFREMMKETNKRSSPPLPESAEEQDVLEGDDVPILRFWKYEEGEEQEEEDEGEHQERRQTRAAEPLLLEEESELVERTEEAETSVTAWLWSLCCFSRRPS